MIYFFIYVFIFCSFEMNVKHKTTQPLFSFSAQSAVFVQTETSCWGSVICVGVDLPTESTLRSTPLSVLPSSADHGGPPGRTFHSPRLLFASGFAICGWLDFTTTKKKTTNQQNSLTQQHVCTASDFKLDLTEMLLADFTHTHNLSSRVRVWH